MKNINVGIADDHTLFREGLRMIISQMHDITLTVEASGGDDLLEQLTYSVPDVVLLDVEMKYGNGMETLKRIKHLPLPPKVLILTMHHEPRMIMHLMELGAAGCLQKDIQKEELEAAIRAVEETGLYVNHSLTNFLISGLQNKRRKSSFPIELSPREKEVLIMICREYTNQEIAESLFISERTVEGHRKNLCSKTGVKNTAGLVRKAIQLNLVDLE